MSYTGRRVIQKIVALLLVIIMTFADFSIIGANVISYAIDMVATNSDNVEFFAYFINEQEEKVTSIESAINEEDLKMYVEVSVKNEGYFNGEIALGDSSFNFIDNVSNEFVKQIKDNTVTLNQIKAGTVAKIELEIAFKNSEEINKTLLNQETEINLKGTYTSSKKDVEIKGKTKVQVNWKSPKDIKAKLDTKILTNSIYKVNDVNKRIVQVLINSKLNNNSYPVKETNIELNIPNGVEEVKVHSRGTYATNGEQDKYDYNYDLNAEDLKLTIKSKNEEQNEKISWNKDSKDTFVVTYVYPEGTSFNYEKVNSNVTITTYDDKQVKDESQALISENIDGIVTNEILEKEKEIYKGKIYIGEKREYTSRTVLNIDYYHIIEKIQLLEEEAKFKTEDEEKNTNIQFVKTKINKSDFIKLFGEEGYIKFLDLNDNVLQTINNSSEIDDDGNIVVEHAKNEKVVVIQTSKPISNGVLNIVHTKSILDNDLSRKEIRDLVEIKEQVNSSVTKNDGNNFKNEIINTIKLKETSMQTKIEVDRQELTTVSKNEGVTIQATLLTYGEDKELYKDPKIEIKLPKAIENIEQPQVKMLYGNGLEIEESSLEEKDGIKTFYIQLKGEQEKYSNETVEGTIIQFRFNCSINKLSTTKQQNVELIVDNENLDDKTSNKTSIMIINPNNMITVNQIKGYEDKNNIKLNANEKEKEMTANLQVINNEQGTISNVKVLGILPTDSTKNNMGNSLYEGLSVNIEKAKVYYTENENATDDINDKNNKWEEDISKNVKKYLIIVDKLENSEQIKANYKIKIQENLKYNLFAESTYEVKYFDDTSSKEKEINSLPITFLTEEKAEIKQTIKATVGDNILNDGDDVNVGEFIKYQIILENTSNIDVKDVKVVASVPENTTRVILNEVVEDDTVIVGDDEQGVTSVDYVETEERSVIFNNINIKQSEKITLEFEVKVNNDIIDNTKAICEILTTYKNENIKNTIKHNLKTATVSLQLKTVQREPGVLKSGYNYDYSLAISNNSNTEQNDVKINLSVNDLLKITGISYDYEDSMVFLNDEQINSEFTIPKIKQGETINVLISTIVQNETEELKQAEISATITNSDNTQYRSNKIAEAVETVQLDISVKSTTNSTKEENYVVPGDTIKYTITVKNNGEVDANSLVIKDKFINYLSIKEVKLNDKTINYDKEITYEEENSYSIISINAPLKSGEKCTIELLASVNDITSNEILKITNNVSAFNNIYLKEVDANIYYIQNKDVSTIIPETGGETELPSGEHEDQENTDPDIEEENKPIIEKYIITGNVWYDENKDGKRETEELNLNEVNVNLLNSDTYEFIQTVKTGEDGFYSFTNIPKGKYIVVFEYNTELYIPTIYQAEGILNTQNSDAIKGKMKINNEEKVIARTDSINLNKDLSNIDLGLIKAEKFDFELNKYIKKISVINDNGTKTYDFDKSTLAKVEIDAKYLKSSNVIIEYTIEVKNTGELPGYIPNIVDYKSTSFSFSSNLNKDWYQSENYLYNDSLSNTAINAGETKTITLVLSRQMTESNTGLVNNTAEISKAYNTLGIEDMDSTPGNNQKGEDDLGSADAIIGIRTGAAVSYIVLTLLVVILLASGAYLINKKVLNKFI